MAKYLKFTVLVVLFSVFSGFSSIPDHNKTNIDVLHYSLNLNLLPEAKQIKGITEIKFLLKDSAKKVSFNFYDNMIIHSVRLNNEKVDFTRHDNKISFHLPKSYVLGDTLLLNVDYEGTPEKKGLSGFVFGKINGQTLIYNLNEPDFASTWFPCNDVASDKALLDIYLTNDSAFTSVSNGKLEEVLTEGAKRTFHWKTYYPISTYLICLYSSIYKNFDDYYVSQDKKDTMAIKYYVLPEHLEFAKKDFEDHPDMIDVYAKLFGEYPFIKEKYGVAEFLWQYGAMEHQTITGIGSNFVSGNKYFSDIYAHELSHHWWGDAIAPGTWNDIWLNEGFATYSEALYQEYKYGDNSLRAFMLSKFSKFFPGVLYKPGTDLFSQTEYDKGGWVLHMLRWEVGDSAFFKILRTYFETFKYQSAVTNDFKEICEKLSGKDLTKFFDQWVYSGEGQINLSADWQQKEIDKSYQIEFDFRQTQTEYEVYNFTLPIKVIYQDGTSETLKAAINKRKSTFTFTVPKKVERVLYDPQNWILLNLSNNKNNK